MDDSSDTERIDRKEILKRYKNNPVIKKYEKFISNINNYLIDIKEKTIDEILNETIITFFELKPKLDGSKKNELMDKLSMLYHKLKQLPFFNLMITYCHFIQKIVKNIEDDRGYHLFNTRTDIIAIAVYDMELNKKLNHKIFSLKITSTSLEKYDYLKGKLEKYIYNNDSPFIEYDVVPGPYPDGYGILINMRDSYLILNDETNKEELIRDMKVLFKKYGINEKYINWWKNNSYSRKVQNYEEKKNDENDKIKIDKEKIITLNEENKKLIIEKNKEKWNGVVRNLVIHENNIKKNFK
jgi:hypothetical protein